MVHPPAPAQQPAWICVLASKSRKPDLILAAILLLALILRLPPLLLGLPEFCNEDEAHVNAGAVRMTANLSLDPGSQKYPALIFELAAAADLISILAPQARAVLHLESPASFRYWLAAQKLPLAQTILLGRLLCLALALLSLMLFHSIVRRQADPLTALLATLLMAVAPVHLWLSALLKPDLLLLLAVILCLHAGYRIGRHGRNLDYAFGALALALALASKFYFLAATPLLAGAVLAGSARSRLAWLREPRLWLMLLAALLLFAALSPYSFIHWRQTAAWLNLEALNQSGAVPILKRTTGRLWHAPGLFILTSVLPLAFGIPLYLLALAGIPDLFRLARPAKYAWLAFAAVFLLNYSLASRLGSSHIYFAFAPVICLAAALRVRRGLTHPARSRQIIWAAALGLVVIYNSILTQSLLRAEVRSIRQATDFLLNKIPASAPTAALVPYHPDPALFPPNIKFYPYYQLSPANLEAVDPEFLIIHPGTFRLAADNPENQDPSYFAFLQLEAGKLGFRKVWQVSEPVFQERVYGFLMPDALGAFSFAAYQRNRPRPPP